MPFCIRFHRLCVLLCLKRALKAESTNRGRLTQSVRSLVKYLLEMDIGRFVRLIGSKVSRKKTIVTCMSRRSWLTQSKREIRYLLYLESYISPQLSLKSPLSFIQELLQSRFLSPWHTSTLITPRGKWRAEKRRDCQGSIRHVPQTRAKENNPAGWNLFSLKHYAPLNKSNVVSIPQ